MSSLLPFAVIALVLVNLCTILRFWQAKERAKAGERRIPGGDLLGLAMIGGPPGALLAGQLFRHETRKEPFSTQLLLIVYQAGAASGLPVAFAQPISGAASHLFGAWFHPKAGISGMALIGRLSCYS